MQQANQPILGPSQHPVEEQESGSLPANQPMWVPAQHPVEGQESDCLQVDQPILRPAQHPVKGQSWENIPVCHQTSKTHQNSFIADLTL